MKLGLYFDWWAMGPGEVFKYLKMGLNHLKVNYVINEPGDINWFVQANRTLYQKPFPKFKNLYLGPNIVEIPSECDVMMDIDCYNKVILPSNWVKDLFSKQIPIEKIEVWHSGIDLNRWCEKEKNIEYDFLIYFKNRNEKDVTAVINFFEKNNLKYKVMKYGNLSWPNPHRPTKQYTEDEVIKLIQDFYVSSLGNSDPNTDEERNFTNPNGRNYIDLDRIKSRIVDFMKDK